MKKILLIIALFGGFIANSQSGYTLINSRYNWLAGIFKALGLPAGSTPAFTAGQAQQAGAVYMDTVGADAGLYIYLNGVWVLQGTGAAADLPNDVISGGEIIYSGTGYVFNIKQAFFRLNNQYYVSDSGSFTLSAADGSLNRIDRVYFDLIGAKFHVLEGTPGIPAAEPQVDPDQIPWSIISVPAGSSSPITVVVYDENTESTTTNTGTTTDPDDTSNPFRLLKDINVTNINTGDQIDITAPLTWNIANASAFSYHIKLKAVLAAVNSLQVQFVVGGTAVTQWVKMPFDRLNTTTYQPGSIPISNFGTIQSYDITGVRFRFIGSAAVYSGFYLDYISFPSGITQPGPGGGVNSVDITMPTGWTVTGPSTGAVVKTITAPGLRSQDMRGDGTAETDSSVKYIGTINSQTKSANGAVINSNQLILQESDASNTGLTSAFRHRQIDTLLNQTIENGDNTLDTLVYPIDEFRTAVKSLKDSTGIGIVDNGTYLSIYATGGGGGGFFSPDQTSTGSTIHNTDINDFILRGNGFIAFRQDDGTDSVTVTIGNQHVIMYAADISGFAQSKLDFGLGQIIFDHWGGDYQYTNLTEPPGSTNKMMVWDSTTNQMHVTAISAGGGGGSTLFGLSGTNTATGAVVADLDGNTLEISSGGETIIGLDLAGSIFQAIDLTDDDNKASLNVVTSSTTSEFTLLSDFNAGVNQASIHGHSDVTESLLQYEATIHTFTGAVSIVDGTEAAGYVFTSDASGNGSWQAGGSASIAQGWFDDTLTIGATQTIINRADVKEEFYSTPFSITAGASNMLEFVSGTGADATTGNTAGSMFDDKGWLVFQTGSTPTGLASVSTMSVSTPKLIVDTTHKYRFETVIRLEDLGSATDSFRVLVGQQPYTANYGSTNEISFRYSNDHNSGKWTTYSNDNAAGGTATDSGVTLVADTEYRLGYEFDGEQILFYIDGALVATHTTNIPLQGGNLMAPVMSVTKMGGSTGTTNNIVYADYLKFRIVR